MIRLFARVPARQIAPRSFILPPVQRHFSHHRTGYVRFQQVKIRRPWLRRTLVTLTVYCAAAVAYTYIVLTPVEAIPDEEFEESEEDNLKKEEKEDSEGQDSDHEDDTLFIPLGWPRSVPGEPYAAGDPEQETFDKYRGDAKSRGPLRHQLVDHVLAAARKNQKIAEVAGSPVRVINAVVHLQFPTKSPPGYVRSGVEIRDDGSVAWTERLIPTEVGDRLRAFLLPGTVGLSLLMAGKALIETKMKRLKAGLSGDPFQPPWLEGIEQDVTSGGAGTTTGTPGTQDKSKNFPGSPESPETMPKETENTSEILPILGKWPLQGLVDSKADPDLIFASFVFKNSFKKLRKPNRTIPRGTFFVTGLTVLHGPRGFATVYATGIYDPAQSKWLGFDMALKGLGSYPPKPKPVEK